MVAPSTEEIAAISFPPKSSSFCPVLCTFPHEIKKTLIIRKSIIVSAPNIVFNAFDLSIIHSPFYNINYSAYKNAAFQAKDGTCKMSSPLSCDTNLKTIEDLCNAKKVHSTEEYTSMVKLLS